MKKQEDDSSLELLLDTMCNTFGGVMFIAISLVVIISMTNSARNALDSTCTVEELTAQIQQLQSQLDDAIAEQKQLQQLDVTFSNDPRLKQLAELAKLEENAKQLQLQVELEQQSANAANLKFQTLHNKHQQDLQTLQELTKKIQEAEKRSEELEETIANLQTEKNTNSLKMVFTTLETKDEMPYYIALVGDKVWRIGPDDNNNLEQPNSDVEYKYLDDGDGRLVICTPKSSAGVPALDGDNISRQLLNILSNVPAKRVPRFMVTKSSAPTFYALREKLKKSGKFHGFFLNQSESEFEYLLTDSVNKYEY